MSGPAWDGLDLSADDAVAGACALPAGEGPEGFRLEREVPDPGGGPGRVTLEAWGMTEPALLVAVARAVAALVTGAASGGAADGADEVREVELDAEDTAARLVAWIEELLTWVRRDGFVVEDGALRLREPGGLVGAARGRRWASLPLVSLRPTEEDLLVAATCSRWIARVALAPQTRLPPRGDK